MNPYVLAILAGAMRLGAAQAAPQPSPQSTPTLAAPSTARDDPALLAVLWTQHAAEHHALCRQAFNSARVMLEPALKDPEWTAALEQSGRPGIADLPPAIVVDADETVIDNSAFQARCVLAGAAFTADAWAKWAQEAQAAAVPGAVEFTNAVARRGVTIFYVTNRTHELEEATRANLARLGFPLLDADGVDVVLTRNEYDKESDKGTRRARVATTHRILMVFGDDLGDFLSAVKLRQTARNTIDSRRREGEAMAVERQRRSDEFATFWGTRWFMLPNAMYGSWLETLKACAVRHGDATASAATGLAVLLVTREIAIEPAAAK